MITKLEEIIQTVQGQPRKKLAVAYAQDSHTLEAVGAAVDMGIVEAILVGDRDEIERVCMADEIDPEKFSVIDQKSDVACVATAVKMIHDGMADILMKGLVSTDKYMRGILDKEVGLLPPKGVLSHVAVLELPMYHKLLLVSDVAVIPYPDLDQKVRITRYLIEAARALGVQKPKVAVVAPSEQMLPKIQSAVDAAILSKNGRPRTVRGCADRRAAGGGRGAGEGGSPNKGSVESGRRRCRLPAVPDAGRCECLFQGGEPVVSRSAGRDGGRNQMSVRTDVPRRLSGVEALFDRNGCVVR